MALTFGRDPWHGRRLREIDAEEAMNKDQQYDTLPVATHVSRDFLDVHKGGLTFRLRIHCDRHASCLPSEASTV